MCCRRSCYFPLTSVGKTLSKDRLYALGDFSNSTILDFFLFFFLHSLLFSIHLCRMSHQSQCVLACLGEVGLNSTLLPKRISRLGLKLN